MKKKFVKMAAIATVFLFLAMPWGHTQAEPRQDGGIVNEAYTEGMDLVSITGNQIKSDDEQLVPFPVFGFSWLIPRDWGAMEDLTMVVVSTGVCIGFVPPSLVPDVENISEEELDEMDFQTPLLQQLKLVKTFYVSSDVDEQEVKAQHSDYQSVDKLATLNGRTYYMAYNSVIEDRSSLTDDDAERYAAYAAQLPALKENTAVFPIQQLHTEDGVTSEQLQALQGTDMQGNQIDAGIFRQYDVTMVNIWATWCAPCVDELPDLAALYQSLPSNMNLITICSDGMEKKETAEALLEEYNAGFVTICGDEKMQSGILQNVYSYPTTFFVDRNGQIVGNQLRGAWPADVYREEMERCMQQITAAGSDSD